VIATIEDPVVIEQILDHLENRTNELVLYPTCTRNIGRVKQAFSGSTI
jgi:hypothetical protein